MNHSIWGLQAGGFFIRFLHYSKSLDLQILKIVFLKGSLLYYKMPRDPSRIMKVPILTP